MKRLIRVIKNKLMRIAEVILANHWIVLTIMTVLYVYPFCKNAKVLAIIVLMNVAEKLWQMLEYKDTIPVYGRRFTIRQKNGDISIKKADIEMSMIYLAQVEDYIERKGLRDE